MEQCCVAADTTCGRWPASRCRCAARTQGPTEDLLRGRDARVEAESQGDAAGAERSGARSGWPSRALSSGVGLAGSTPARAVYRPGRARRSLLSKTVCGVRVWDGACVRVALMVLGGSGGSVRTPQALGDGNPGARQGPREEGRGRRGAVAGRLQGGAGPQSGPGLAAPLGQPRDRPDASEQQRGTADIGDRAAGVVARRPRGMARPRRSLFTAGRWQDQPCPPLGRRPTGRDAADRCFLRQPMNGGRLAAAGGRLSGSEW